MRASQEPVEDLKRRIVAACEEAVLKIESASTYAPRTKGQRVIHVVAHTPEGPFQESSVSVLATIHVDGRWSGMVDVKCSAAEDDDISDIRRIPIMRGRDSVPLAELAEQLKRTVEEREQVVAARKMGVEGPYVFDQSRWETPPEIMMPWTEG